MQIILLDGMTGSGKSTTAKLLGGYFPRTAIIGMDRVKKFLSDFERGSRDNVIARKIIQVMSQSYLDQGISLIIEHPFLDRNEIEYYEGLAKDFCIDCHKFQFYVDPEIAFQRITERQKEKEDKVPEERIKRNIGLFEKRDDFFLIDTTNKNPDEVIQIVLSKFE